MHRFAQIEAIRSATSDLLLGTQPVLTTIAVHRFGDAKRIQVRGARGGKRENREENRDTLRRHQAHPGAT